MWAAASAGWLTVPSASRPLATAAVLRPGVPTGLLSPGTARHAPLSEGCGAYGVSPWLKPKFAFAALFPPALKNKLRTDDLGSSDCCQRTRASHVFFTPLPA